MDPVSQNSSVVVGSLLEKIVDQMMEGFQVIDKDWKYIYVNQTVALQGKNTKEELLGKTMMECYPGIDKTPLFDHLRKCMNEKVDIRLENEFEYPDKTKGWFQLHIHPVTEGILILSLDVTAHKKAQIELYEKIQSLDALESATIDRELKMIKLKETIASLQKLMPSVSTQLHEMV